MIANTIKVLVIEDATSMGPRLAHVLSADPGIQIVGTAESEPAALELLARCKPDVATVDTSLRRADAFDLTRRIMERHPIPVVMVGAICRPQEVAMTFAALEAGAVAVAGKPEAPGHSDHPQQARQLAQTIRAMSEVRVVRRRARARPAGASLAANLAPPPRQCKISAVAVGASTGGPLVLQIILARLTKDFSAPLLIVQHIAPGFAGGLAEWLTVSTRFPVRVAAAGDALMPRHAYLAPDGCQMGVGRDGCIALGADGSNAAPCPSVSHLFASVGQAFGASTAAVLLTGMGVDGAEELKHLREKGALTVAQDRESCVVYGMPGRAVAIDAAMYVLNPEGIADLLECVVTRTEGMSAAGRSAVADLPAAHEGCPPERRSTP
jgi:two-component system chemotaxis response regulator CheB